jgi:hypothetical protein
MNLDFYTSLLPTNEAFLVIVDCRLLDSSEVELAYKRLPRPYLRYVIMNYVQKRSQGN